MKIKIVYRKSKNGKKYRLTPVGIFFLVLLCFFLPAFIGELMIRQFVFFPLKKEYLLFKCNRYRKIPQYTCDEDLFWEPIEEFKGVRYEQQKPLNTFRVICIGDSVTQGYDGKADFLPREQTYVYSLEQLLKKRSGCIKNVEVINAGNGGYSSLQGLRYLKRKLWRYSPDLVISWFGINDSTPAVFYEDKQQRLPGNEELSEENILERSKLYLFIKNYFFIKETMVCPMVRISPEDYHKNCEEMILFAKEKNFKIAFVVPFKVDYQLNVVNYPRAYQEKLEILHRVYKCEIIKLGDLEKYNLKRLFVDLSHPNHIGNTIIAQSIYASLNEEWAALINKTLH